MSHIKRLREIQYQSTTDLLKEVARKAQAGALGSTPAEMLTKAHDIIGIGSNNLEHALRLFITEDPEMIRMKAKVKMLYNRAEPVLITGPTGTGKELLAKALTIPGAPFVAENCGALPENLVESIFFGHVKGAFTGAHDDKTGLLEEAGEGIIFLDEIGDMSMAIQAKFLRAIQEGQIRRVGSTETTKLECRFIAATKYDLEERVDRNLFREDLYARLFIHNIKVTGLIDRPNDIPVITKALMGNPNAFPELPPFEKRHMDMIFKYNVRAIEALLARHEAYESYD